ncbi:adenosylmethionine--8-amino-7-oxononanoate transaminase [Candidatus Omnitrophota bacterium]
MVFSCKETIKINQLRPRKTDNRQRAEEVAVVDKKYVWHPFTQMKDWLKDSPLVIDRAEGSYVFDGKGNRYLDGVSSLWVTVHGHRHKDINAAVKRQIEKLDHSTLLGCANTPSVELAKKLVEITPQGLEKVFYSDSGSTSVEIAIKMAYQYWQNKGCVKKRNLVHLANSYHGDTLGSVSVGGIGLFHKVYKHLIPKTIQVEFPDCYRAPAGQTYPQVAFDALQKIEKLFKEKHHEIAAFIVEPLVQGAAGMIMWPKGILKKMAQIAAQHEILLIVDEVATGFGRTGKMFACEQEGVKPDIMCLAKGITGGVLPLAATLTTQKIFDGFCFDYKEQKTFFHGHTYTGNPICCAAALASLAVFKKEKTIERLQPKIKYLQSRLKTFKQLSAVGDIRQCGFMVGIELVADRKTKKAFHWEEQIGVKVCAAARERGVLLRPLGNVIVLMPPLSISLKELKTLCDVTRLAIDEVVSVDGMSGRGAHEN